MTSSLLTFSNMTWYHDSSKQYEDLHAVINEFQIVRLYRNIQLNTCFCGKGGSSICQIFAVWKNSSHLCQYIYHGQHGIYLPQITCWRSKIDMKVTVWVLLRYTHNVYVLICCCSSKNVIFVYIMIRDNRKMGLILFLNAEDLMYICIQKHLESLP